MKEFYFGGFLFFLICTLFGIFSTVLNYTAQIPNVDIALIAIMAMVSVICTIFCSMFAILWRLECLRKKS